MRCHKLGVFLSEKAADRTTAASTLPAQRMEYAECIAFRTPLSSTQRNRVGIALGVLRRTGSECCSQRLSEHDEVPSCRCPARPAQLTPRALQAGMPPPCRTRQSENGRNVCRRI